MKTLRRLLAYWTNHRTQLPDICLNCYQCHEYHECHECHECQLDRLHHEIERFSRNRWL